MWLPRARYFRNLKVSTITASVLFNSSLTDFEAPFQELKQQALLAVVQSRGFLVQKKIIPRPWRMEKK